MKKQLWPLHFLLFKKKKIDQWEDPWYWQFRTGVKRVWIITFVFETLYFSQYKQKSLQAFEVTLAANSSTVPSEGWYYRLFRQKYFFVLKILPYCTMLWGSRIRNPTFAWLQDLQYIAICHFLSRNPSTAPTLTCQEAELCTAPTIPKVRGEFVSEYVGFINYFKIKCSNIMLTLSILGQTYSLT